MMMYVVDMDEMCHFVCLLCKNAKAKVNVFFKTSERYQKNNELFKIVA